MADLPGLIPVRTAEAQRAQWAGPPWLARLPGPRLLPLAALALLALLMPGGGWLLFAFFKLILMFWLVTCLAAIFAAGRLRRRMQRRW